MPKPIKKRKPPAPSETVEHGAEKADKRDARGRFTAGNKAARGNTSGKKMAHFRAMLMDCVSDIDFIAVVNRLIRTAKKGSSWATKILLEYTVGPARDIDIVEQLEKMQADILEAKQNRNQQGD